MALLVFPLTFVSSAYVPVETMPGWMQAIAEHQPITYMVDAVRSLTQGEAAEVLFATRRATTSAARCCGRSLSSRPRPAGGGALPEGVKGRRRAGGVESLVGATR